MKPPAEAQLGNRRPLDGAYGGLGSDWIMYRTGLTLVAMMCFASFATLLWQRLQCAVDGCIDECAT